MAYDLKTGKFYDILCPYCKEKLEIDHDDGYGYDEDKTHHQRCTLCKKVFVYTTMISFDYDVYEAPCLNGEEHDLKPYPIYPEIPTWKICKICDEKIIIGDMNNDNK